MASLANDPGGTRRVLVMVDGKRKPIRLGKIPKKQAEGILRHVEALAASRLDGSTPPDATTAWLSSVSTKLRERLTTIGLAAPAARPKAATVGELVEKLSAQRFPRLKPRTVANYKRSFARFSLFVGAGTQVADVTPGDAEAFRDELLNCGHSESYVRRFCADACILLGYAVKHRIVDRNAFIDCGDAIPRKIRGTKRVAEITPDVFATVLAAEDDPELRLAYCLSRYGGLRVPSELGGLRWRDIDWGRGRFRVESPKTERYEDRGERIVPLFPELMAPLEALYVADNHADDAFVLPTLRDRAENYVARRLKAAIKRAGVKRWPRIMHNMRATRQTELVAAGFDPYVVCDWLGNSLAVADEHYLRVRESDFERATKVAHFPAQRTPAESRTEPQAATAV